MNVAPGPTVSTLPDEGEVRVGEVRGDRMCVKCGFNLLGQHILREPMYRLLIVRCTECGTVSSMLDYPVLGRWAKRWGVAIAAVWFLCIIASLLSGAGLLGAFLVQAGEVRGRVMGSKLALAHKDWFIATDQETALRSKLSDPQLLAGLVREVRDNPGSWSNISLEWWEQTGKALAQTPPFLAYGDEVTLVTLGVSLVAMLICGVWSCMLVGLGRWRVIVVPLGVGALGIGIGLVISALDHSFRGSRVPGYQRAAHLAIASLWWVGLVSPVLLVIGAGMIGSVLGRPVFRLLARTLLLPRQVGAFAFMWEADGKVLRGKRRHEA